MKIGLCLGGGGARGFAHIGVMKALNERGIRPSAIAGCSMGGIIGALAAIGTDPDDMAARFRDMPPIRIMDHARKGGLMGHKGIDRALADHFPETFEDLDVPLAVTAVDVQEGKVVVLRKGPLIPALRATSAIPGVFTPVHHKGCNLIDGGLLNNVPMDVIDVLTLDPVVAVDVSAPADRKLIFEDNRSLRKKLRQPTPEGQRPLTIELFMKAYDIPTALITQLRLAAHRPEMLITPDLDPNLKLEDFNRLDEAIGAGYRAAIATLDRDFSKLEKKE